MSEENNCTDDINKSKSFFVRKYRFLDSNTVHQQHQESTSFNNSTNESFSANDKSLMSRSMESSISECIPKSDENSSEGGLSTTDPLSVQPFSIPDRRKVEVPKLKGIPPSIFKPSPNNHQAHHHTSARVQSASSRSSKAVSNPSTYFSSLATVRNAESKASTTTAPYPSTSKHSERSLDSSLSSSTYQFHSGKIPNQSPPQKPHSATSGRKSYNSIQVSWKDARQSLRNSFSASNNTPKSTKKYNSFISDEPQDCTYDSILSTPRQATTICDSDCDSSTNSIVTASPIPNLQSYEDVLNSIEQDNDLQSVESYQTGTTLHEGTYWDQSDLLLRTGIMVREPHLSPNSEYLLNSTYMKLKMTSPRVYESLVKQIEIEGPTERLPNSPIVKEVERFYHQKEIPKKQLAYPLLPPVQTTVPATPSFEKPGGKEKRENKIRLRVEKELIRSQQMSEYRNRQRMLYKEDLEISREQHIAQYEMFKKQKLKELKKKMAGSPFLIDMEAHAKKTEKEIRRSAKINEKLRLMESKKKEDLRKCELIERIIEKSKEDIHTTRRNFIDYERDMKVVLSARLNK